MRITELEAKSKVSAAPPASSSSVESEDCPSPTVYWWCLNAHVRRSNASTRPLHVQPNPFSQSSCILVLAEGGSLTLIQRFVANIATIHCRTSQLTPQAQKKLTPQADREPGQYWSGHDWYSKLIRFEHEQFIGCWNSKLNFVLCTMEICWLPKSKKLESIVPQQKLDHGGISTWNRWQN